MWQVRCPVLLGREEERRVLLDVLDRARAGRGGTYFVVGEAGVGKSRLAREIGDRAQSAGLTVAEIGPARRRTGADLRTVLAGLPTPPRPGGQS